jgi:hypothetical protein
MTILSYTTNCYLTPEDGASFAALTGPLGSGAAAPSVALRAIEEERAKIPDTQRRQFR